MEFGKNRWKVLGFELRNVKHYRSKALWKACALISAVVVGMVMETLRRRSKTLRAVKPEIKVSRGRVRVALRGRRRIVGAEVRRRSVRGGRAPRSNGAARIRRAVRAAARA